MGSSPETSIPIHSGSLRGVGGGEGGGSKTPVMSSSTRGQNTQTDDPLCQTLHQLYAENFP